MVITINAFVLGGVAMFYVYGTYQTAHAAAEAAAVDQASRLMDDVAWHVSNSVKVEIKSKNGINAIRCKMPLNGTDTDGDGRIDQYRPNKIDAAGREEFEFGKRVWFYFSDSTGKFGNSGSVLWRAERNDDSDPIETDAHTTWAYYTSAKKLQRFPLIYSLEATVDSSACSATIRIVAAAADFTESSLRDRNIDTSRLRWQILTRTVFWRHWNT